MKGLRFGGENSHHVCRLAHYHFTQLMISTARRPSKKLQPMVKNDQPCPSTIVIFTISPHR